MSEFLSIKSEIANLITDTLTENKCILFGINKLYEFDQDIIQIRIDNQDHNITLDLLTRISNQINKIIDEKTKIKEFYALEITTAGAEREIANITDLKNFLDKKVNVCLKKIENGKVCYEGKLVDVNEEKSNFKLELNLKGKIQYILINYENVDKVTVSVSF